MVSAVETERYKFKYSANILVDENLCSASRRQVAGKIDSTSVIAAAISSALLTRNPVRWCVTISLSAPLGNATTGAPAAIASIATSELVSGTRLDTSKHRAPASRFAL